MRYMFGGTTADYVISKETVDSTSNVAVFPTGATVTFWTEEVGGQQVTDLTDLSGSPTSTISANEDGDIPAFYGPDNGATVLWASADGGPRRKMVADFTPLATEVSDLSDQVSNMTGSQVSSVDGRTGFVTLSDLYISQDEKGANSGVAPLGSNGKVPSQYLPESQTVSGVSSVNGQTGDVTITPASIGALSTSYVPPVQSVNGMTGNVVISTGGGEGGGVGVAVVVASSTASSDVKASAAYVCDGTGDQSEINSAISDVQSAGGGFVQLTEGTYNLASPVVINGPGSADNTRTVSLRGVGERATILNPASGVNGIEIGSYAQCHLGEFGILIRGAGIGIKSTGVEDDDYRSFWNSSFKNIRINGAYNAAYTGWAMDLDTPFRSVFENIEVEGTRNGIRLTNNSAIQNGGDCAFTRIFVEIVGDNGYGLQVLSNAGVMNQNNFSMFEAFAGGTGCTGIWLGGDGTTSSQRFWGTNLEQFDILIHVDNGNLNEFDLNYVTARTGGSGNEAFKFGEESWCNTVRAKWVQVEDGDALILIDDENSNDNAPNVIEKVLLMVNTGGLVTAYLPTATVIRDIVAFNEGTIQNGLLVPPGPVQGDWA